MMALSGFFWQLTYLIHFENGDHIVHFLFINLSPSTFERFVIYFNMPQVWGYITLSINYRKLLSYLYTPFNVHQLPLRFVSQAQWHFKGNQLNVKYFRALWGLEGCNETAYIYYLSSSLKQFSRPTHHLKWCHNRWTKQGSFPEGQNWKIQTSYSECTRECRCWNL